MNITPESLPGLPGGRMVADIDGAEVGYVRWRVAKDGTWVFDRLSVDADHREQGIATALMEAAREHRVAEGDAPWKMLPPTAVGAIVVNKYVAANYETDPREGANHG